MDHPFTNVQWFMSGQRNTAYFGAFTARPLSPDDVRETVRRMLALAPQFNWREDRRGQRHVDARPFALDDIIRYETVETLDGLPDMALGARPEIFDDSRLPALRVACWTRRTPIPDGPNAFLLLQASHALGEGADTAAILRGRPVLRAAAAAPQGSRLMRLLALPLAFVIAPLHLVAARFRRRHRRPLVFRTLVIDRGSVKAAARRLGVRQSALLFGLVLFVLFVGRRGLAGRKPIVFGHSHLPAAPQPGDDGFIRMRMRTGMAWPKRDVAAFVQALGRRLARTRRPDGGGQVLQMAALGVHRRLARLLPFLYGPRFFAYVPYDFILAVLPPHRRTGAFADLAFRDVYAGAHTPGIGSCVLVPQGDRISLNFLLDGEGVARFGRLTPLLAAFGITTCDPLAADPALRTDAA